MINTPKFCSGPKTYDLPLLRAKALPARLADSDVELMITSECEPESLPATKRQSVGRPRIPLPRGPMSESDMKKFRRRAANRESARRMRANKKKRVAELESEAAQWTKSNEQSRNQGATAYTHLIALRQTMALAVKLTPFIPISPSTTDDSVFEPPGLDAKTFAEMARDYGLL